MAATRDYVPARYEASTYIMSMTHALIGSSSIATAAEAHGYCGF